MLEIHTYKYKHAQKGTKTRTSRPYNADVIMREPRANELAHL